MCIRDSSAAEHQQLAAACCDMLVPHTSVLGVIDALPKDRDIVVYCKLGGRSQMAIMGLIQAGVPAERLWNLEGGIMAWNAFAPEQMVRG